MTKHPTYAEDQDPLDELVATLTEEEKDRLVRGAIMVCAALGQEFEWESGTLDEVVGNLDQYIPASFPAWYDQNTADENYWRQFTGADPIPTRGEDPDE